jgi:hypothetical protein
MEYTLAGETEVLGENLPQRHFCPSQNPTWPDPRLNSGRRVGKPATNRLSYGAAFHSSNKAYEAVSDFAASLATEYRLSTRKTTILGGKYELPALDLSLKHTGKVQKIMARNRRSSIQNGSKPVLSKCQENCLEKSNWEVEGGGKPTTHFKQYDLLQNPSEIGWTIGTIRNSWSLRPHILCNW